MLTQPRAAVPLSTPADTVTEPEPTWLARLWVVPVLVTAVLGLWRASSIDLWWDELSTVDIARRPFTGIIATAGHVDAVHTLYYLFMHVWIAVFGTSPLSVRLPSVLAMCGATACTSAIAKRLFDRRIAFTAAMIFSLIPGVARYAEEARSYGFVVFGAAAAFLLLLRTLEKPSPRRWKIYGAMLALTGALNLIALMAIAGHAVAVLSRARAESDDRATRRREYLKPFAIAVGVALLIDAPIIILGAFEAENQLGDLNRATVSDLPSMWRDIGSSAPFSLLVLLALPLLLSHRKRGSELTILASATFPVLALWLVSLFGLGFDSFARYLLFVLPAWAIAIAVAVDRLWPARNVALAAIVLVTAVAVSVDQLQMHGHLSHFKYDYPGASVLPEDYSAAAAIVKANYQPGDAATFGGSVHIDLGVNEYLPADEQLRDIFVQDTDTQQNSLTPVYCTSTVACLAKAPDRVWMLETGFVAPYAVERADWSLALMLKYNTVQVWHVWGVTVTLLERR
ncbi:glycosyltransferase family 39 protein [Actinospica sp.]|jgi:mannosyltransferase|uniref:glycosyltransferase family 39 protein n=1 Tax=Actinospica sp. TaxID=1872142 RepID=UPI002B8C17F4|nr:glycosyltransferase family 39 protein [Actinospica sp.]HWG27358.1 glycosyltransferase family 39 protein [Actinospica sp.]